MKRYFILQKDLIPFQKTYKKGVVMGISLGLVGLGAFGGAFAKLFKAHPLVDRIGLCDSEASKLKQWAENPFMQDKVSPKDLYTTLDEICKADFDAIVINTQPWLHAPQCLQVLESGKSVYCAVPVISRPDEEEILDWCGKLKEAVAASGRHYMQGETTFYHPQTMFCKKMAAEGRFGHFIYAEGEYVHDLDADCSLREVSIARKSGVVGRQYDEYMRPYRERGLKYNPMFYPTHSISGPLAVMNTRATKVSACGYRHRDKDPFFANYDFSDMFALYHLENGATLRIAEFRECGCRALDRKDWETFRIVGTAGSFGTDAWEENKRVNGNPAVRPLIRIDMDPREMCPPFPKEVERAFHEVQIMALPPDKRPGAQNAEFVPSGHGGSHPYLVHEFCTSVAENRKPEIDIDTASHWAAMGVAASKSARKDGELMPVEM